MKEILIDFPDRGAIEAEAATWLIRLDGDEDLSSTEVAALQEWLRRSPVHQKELKNLASLWGKMNVLTKLAVPLARGYSPQSKYIGMHQRLFRGAVPRYFAAGFAVMAASISVFLMLGRVTEPVEDLDSNGIYLTAVGQQSTTALSDGSLVELNTNSRIEVEYDEDFRDIVLLQGEAHFTVTKDIDRPFRVYVGDSRIQAVGTAFSVYMKDDGVNVTVLDGSVALAVLDQRASSGKEADQLHNPNDSIAAEGIYMTDDLETLGTLIAGQSAVMRHASTNDMRRLSLSDVVETIDKSEIERRLSWRDGFLTFSGETLEEALKEISRYTTVTIEISDPQVKDLRIGGRIPVGETQALFHALETNFGLRVTRIDRQRVGLSSDRT